MRAARLVVLGVIMGLALPKGATAFWPFTRDMRVTLPDSATTARLDSLYQVWKVGGRISMADSTGASRNAPGTPLGTFVANAAGSRPAGAPPAAPQGQPEGAPPAGGAQTEAGTGAETGDAFGAPPDSASSAGPFFSAADSAQVDSTDSSGSMGDLAAQAAAEARNAVTQPPLTGAAAAAMVAIGFTPSLSSNIQSSSDFMRTTSSLSANFKDPTGVSLTSTISYGTDLSFTQDTDQRTSALNNQFALPVRRIGLVFGVSTNNTRLRQEGARNISNAATNNFSDTRGAEASARFSRRLVHIPGLGTLRPALRGWSANLFYARRVGANSRSTVATQGAGAGQTRHEDTGNSYGVGVAFDRFRWVAVRARVGTARRNNLDQTALDQPELESKSHGDTATVDVTMPNVWKFTNVTLQFSANEGTDTSVDLARSASGSQTGAVGSYVLDTHSSLRNTVTLATQYQWGRFGLKLNGDVGRTYDNYAIRANAFNDTRRYGYVLDSNFDSWKGIALKATYERHVADVDQDQRGFPNAGTRRNDGRKLYAEGSKQLTKTMKVTAYGEIQLDQAFYDHEGPTGKGDLDELRQRVGVDMTGAIGSAITTQATLYYRTYDQAFIDARRSNLSRNESEYVVRPTYSWSLTDRVTLRQNFGLASKLIEVIFDPSQNTLNRNHYMSTNVDAALSTRLRMNLTWDYRLQDNGTYFTTTGSSEVFFSPSSRTKTDGLGVGVSYEVIPNGKLTFTSRQDAQRIHTFTFADARPKLRSVTDSGNLAIGFDSKLSIKTLKLDCSVKRNQSFNVSLNRKVFYNADATLSYAF